MRCKHQWFPEWMVLAILATAACGGSTTPCDRTTGRCEKPSDSQAAGGAAGSAGAGVSGAAPAGTCDAFVPPPYSSLTDNPKLPDPFLISDGTRMTRSDQWPCRRSEISAQAQKYELGTKAGPPDSVVGSYDATTKAITVTVTAGGKSITFAATISYPTAGTPPYPAMIGIGGISLGVPQLQALGVATINFPNSEIANQTNGSSRGLGKFYDLYGSGHTAGAMMAWAWGIGRLIDALETTPEANIDPTRLGVTGCSRNGKGALIAGAFEERIVLTIPQESGSGGSACWRVSDAQKAAGGNVQTLSQITGENVWFTSSFNQFGNSARRLPFDHHMIEGLVAPRALLVLENTVQEWLGNVSTYTCSMAGHKIWEALGIPDTMGFSQTSNSQHCGWSGDQQPEVTAYVQKFLVGGGTANTNILKTDGSYQFDQATWIDWDLPTLE